MSKPLKLLLAAFVGVDIFVVAYIGLAQARFAIFGEGQIPGGGSALDMALFLVPMFLGYVAGDRLYFFLTYKERREAKLRASQETVLKQAADAAERPAGSSSVWEDKAWDEQQPVGREESR